MSKWSIRSLSRCGEPHRSTRYMWQAGHILTYPEIGMLLYVDSGIVCHVSSIVQLGSSAAITHHTENASTELKDSQ